MQYLTVVKLLSINTENLHKHEQWLALTENSILNDDEDNKKFCSNRTDKNVSTLMTLLK